MNAIILSIGDELLDGLIADTNAKFLSERLQGLGIRVVGHRAAGDDVAPIASALKDIARVADVCLATGGLGPTLDDRTREGFACAFGLSLARNAAAERIVRAFFRKRPMAVSNLRQADLPRGADPLANPVGTAPGFALKAGRCRFFAMPGVPSEMTRMFEHEVAPRLLRLPGREAIAVRQLHLLPGTGESVVGETIADYMRRGRNPVVGTLVSGGIITVKVVARSKTQRAAALLASDDVADLNQIFRGRIFGADGSTLENEILSILRRRRQTLALAESCTGGLLSKRFTDVPGASDVFVESCVTYANASKARRLGVSKATLERLGAVSEACAREMAEGIRKTARTNWGVGITGVAGPRGGTREKPVGCVHLAVAGPGGVTHRELRLKGDRDTIRIRAAALAGAELWRRLTKD